MAPVMRPANFRHDFRGGIVEITREEYERSKQSILKKIRRRVLILGILLGLLGLISIAAGIGTYAYYANITKFKQKTWSVAIRNLFFIYGGTTVVFSLHGFYLDGKWRKLRQDGTRLVMHVRLFAVLGIAAWVMALWLFIAMIHAFGLVDVRNIAESPPNLFYLGTLIMTSIHLLVAPWLLRTIHRKASQADEYYGAEFLAGVKQSREQQNDEPEDEEEANDSDNELAMVAPVITDQYAMPRRQPSSPRPQRSPTRNRTVFYNGDGSNSFVPPPSSRTAAPAPAPAPVPVPVPVMTSSRSSRSPRHHSSQPSSPRSSDYYNVYLPPRSVRSNAPAEVNLNPVIAEGLLTSSRVSNSETLPFASPVFMMDREQQLTSSAAFWELWQHSETTGSFSCLFRNHPTKKAVEAHLASYGFHIVAIETKDNVLQVHFYGYQFGTDIYFLCEFVFIYARRFFQATFKCKERDAASDFVARFNLQELLDVADNSIE